MKTEEFHKPFIKNLVLVAVATVFAMVSSRYIAYYYLNNNKQPPVYTSYESDIVTKTNK